MKRADTLRVEGRRRRGRPRLRLDDCIETDLAGVGGEWITRARDSGETGGGDGSEIGSVMEEDESCYV